MSGNNSVVECDLAKVEVAGSNPVSRSIRLTWRCARRTARFAHGRPERENALSERSESKGSLARAVPHWRASAGEPAFGPSIPASTLAVDRGIIRGRTFTFDLRMPSGAVAKW